MSWFDVELNAQADSLTARLVTVHLHDDDPGVTGLDNEVSGGSYAAVTLDWSASGVEGPLGSEQPATVGCAYAAPDFEVPADVTVTHRSYRDGGGVVRGVFELVPSEHFAIAGTYTPNVAVGPGA